MCERLGLATDVIDETLSDQLYMKMNGDRVQADSIIG